MIEVWMILIILAMIKRRTKKKIIEAPEGILRK
jgi:hypothetical protein